jgi:alginate O-acetyltransferase complex protein AlgI
LFYAWGEGLFVLVLVASVMINYIAGFNIEHSQKRKKWALSLGVAANLLLLFYFKYFGFFVYDILAVNQFDPEKIPHLPLGISFFTFQSISYLVDIYRKKAKPASSVWDLALYIMMFPQLIAGPIVRYATVARQIRRRTVHLNYVMNGLMFLSIGLSQKVLLANNAGSVADDIFALPLDLLSSSLAWTGSLAYTLQIYFDFAGYSNMAIGLGLIMGFKFPHNFNYPYISQSITEFWRRWHMSLSSWFRDYLHIPLGGNRHGPFRTYRNLLIVFLLCGLWHGASWTFVAWGLYHGLLLISERVLKNSVMKPAPRGLRHLYTLLAVVVGWVLFRSETCEQAASFLSLMFFIADSSELS